MMKSHRLSVPVLLLGCLIVASQVEAASFTFNTSASQFNAGSDNQGWWSGGPGHPNVTANDNYFVGLVGGDVLRDFFTFDLSSLNLSGATIVSATLQLAEYTYSGGAATQTVGFFDVSTPAAILNNNAGLSPAIFADLGTGTTYGSFVVPAYAADNSGALTLSFALNASALADITASAGGFFSIGGSLLSISGNQDQGLFGFGSGHTGDVDIIQRLILDIQPAAAVPEPTCLVLLGTGLVAGTRRWRKSRRTN